jgi:hypothetical protein
MHWKESYLTPELILNRSKFITIISRVKECQYKIFDNGGRNFFCEGTDTPSKVARA